MLIEVTPTRKQRWTESLSAFKITLKVSLTSRACAACSAARIVSSKDPFAAQQNVIHISLRNKVWSDIFSFSRAPTLPKPTKLGSEFDIPLYGKEQVPVLS